MGCSSLPLPHPASGEPGMGGWLAEFGPLCDPPTPECNHDVEPPGGPGWVWTDGSLVDFNAWAGGEPNSWANGVANCDTGYGNTLNANDCVVASFSNDRTCWGDGADQGGKCAEDTNSYVCGFECDENDAEYHVSVPGDRATDIRYCQYDLTSRICTDGYPGSDTLVYGENPYSGPSMEPPSTVAANCRYELHGSYNEADRLPFQAAEEACVARGGHLASIHSVDDFMRVVDVLSPTDSTVW